MTDLLVPPTEASTDLMTERWEVETSVPVTVTGRDADFLLISHAEQALGDFPITLGDPAALFTQLQNHARDELGMLNVVDGLLIWNGRPVLSQPIISESSNSTANQALRALLASFISGATGIVRMEQRRIVEELMERFPVPIFGSPPNAWTALTQLAGTGSCAAFAGYAAWSDQPVLAVIGGGTSLVMWFAKPSAKVVRRSMAERLALKLGTDFRSEDEA